MLDERCTKSRCSACWIFPISLRTMRKSADNAYTTGQSRKAAMPLEAK